MKFFLVLVVIVLMVFVGFFFSFLSIWIRALAAQAPVSFFNLIGMKLRGINPGVIVNARIMAVKAGLPVTTNRLRLMLTGRNPVVTPGMSRSLGMMLVIVCVTVLPPSRLV